MTEPFVREKEYILAARPNDGFRQGSLIAGTFILLVAAAAIVYGIFETDDNVTVVAPTVVSAATAPTMDLQAFLTNDLVDAVHTAISTPPLTPTTIPTAAPSPTMTANEWRLSFLPFCHEVTPPPAQTPMPPQECIYLQTQVATAIPPTPEPTAIPTCPPMGLTTRTTSMYVCTYVPTSATPIPTMTGTPWIEQYAHPRWGGT